MNREEAKNILDAYIFLRKNAPEDDAYMDPGVTALENVILDSMTDVVVAPRPWYDAPKPDWVYEPDRVTCRPLAKEHSYSDMTNVEYTRIPTADTASSGNSTLFDTINLEQLARAYMRKDADK